MTALQQPQNTIPVNNILARPDIWRGSNTQSQFAHSIDCGIHKLRPALPDNGWPSNALTELLSDDNDGSNLSLLMPALARLSQEQSRWIIWVTPPHIPYAPALAQWSMDLSRVLIVHAKPGMDSLWAMNQALRSGTCSAVLGWLNHKAKTPSMSQLRHLQLAAEQGQSNAFLFRPNAANNSPSAAPLRLQTTPAADGMHVKIIKRRGNWAGQEMLLKHASLRAAAYASTENAAYA